MKLRLAVVAALVVLVGVVVVTAIVAFSPQPPDRPVSLTVFTGKATVQRAGTLVTRAGRSGERLASGDSVSTDAGGRAMLTYPDGSVTRLDVSTTVLVHVTASGTNVIQSAGLTWNAVKRLAGGAQFRVSGPNNTTTEVRGTRFGFYIEHDPAGNPVVWVDVYDGLVAVSGATGAPVVAGAQQRVTVRRGQAPTTPVAIPDGDRHLSFTVFNLTLEAVAATPVALQTGTLASGQASPVYTIQADGKHDLQFVLGWPERQGEAFQLTVLAPDGSVFAQRQANEPQISVPAPKARAGTWRYSARALSTSGPETYWLMVGSR